MIGIGSHSAFHYSNWSNELFGELQLILSIFFFGGTFILQRFTMLGGMGPMSYNACRYVISTAVLLFFKYGLKIESNPYEEGTKVERESQKPGTPQTVENKERAASNDLWIYGVALGVTNFGGSILQQIGLVTVTAGKTGFITGMYVVIVPIVEYCVPGYKSNLSVSSWTAAAVSFLGLFLLSGCMGHEQCIGGAIQMGEVLVFLSTLCWVGSILLSDVGAKKVEVVTLTLVDFAVTTVITLCVAVYFEPEAWVYPYTDITSNWGSIVVVGVCEALAFTLSTWGQMYTPPTRCALLYSMEAVVCAILAYFALNETLTPLEAFGGLLMFLSALFSSYYSDSDEEDEADDRSLTGTVEEGQPILHAQKTFDAI